MQINPFWLHIRSATEPNEGIEADVEWPTSLGLCRHSTLDTNRTDNRAVRHQPQNEMKSNQITMPASLSRGQNHMYGDSDR